MKASTGPVATTPASTLNDGGPAFDVDPNDEIAIAAAVRELDVGLGRPVACLEPLLARHR